MKSSVAAQLATLYETKDALVNASIANRPSVYIGGDLGQGSLFAAGGRISIGADTIAGSAGASVKAFGGATVKVQNNTAFDTVVNDIFVPFKVDGAIDFTGKATAIAGVTPTTPGTGKAGSVLIETSKDKYKPSNIVVLGSVNNIAGGFTAKTYNANYIQFGQVNVANFSAESPNGLFTVSLLPTGTFSMGLPINYYYGSSGTVSLYDVTGRGRTVNAQGAIEYVASFVAANKLGLAGLTASEADMQNAFARVYGGSTGDVMHSLYLDRVHRLDPYGNGGARYKGTLYKDGNGDYQTDPAGHTVWGSCMSGSCEFASQDDNILSEPTTIRSAPIVTTATPTRCSTATTSTRSASAIARPL